jgi:hypothetical protein
MPIDLSCCLVFIHIPKTGGTSIEVLLDLRRPINFYSRRPVPGLTPPDKTPQHFTWRELKACLPDGFPEASFKFAFVRNPWDRFVSEFLSKRSSRQSHHKYGKYYSDLDSFVGVLDLPEDVRRSKFDGHLETQRSFVIDEYGKIAMDFVGRFEHFEVDVRHVLRRFARQCEGVPRLNRSDHDGDYRRWFTSYSRAAVERFYAVDIEMFGYEY